MEQHERHDLALRIKKVSQTIRLYEAQKRELCGLLAKELEVLPDERERYDDGVLAFINRGSYSTLDKTVLARLLNMTEEALNALCDKASIVKQKAPYVEVR